MTLLQSALYTLTYSALYLWAFYLLYIFTMGVYRAKLAGRLNGLQKLLLAPVVVVAALADVLCNLTLAALVFWEWPREWLVTTRLKRHHATGRGWRSTFAAWVCDHLLDVFDPDGDHC